MRAFTEWKKRRKIKRLIKIFNDNSFMSTLYSSTDRRFATTLGVRVISGLDMDLKAAIAGICGILDGRDKDEL